MKTTLLVQWDIYMQCGRHICSGAYANNVKCMHTSAVIKLLIALRYIYRHRCPICADELIGIYVVINGHICFSHIWQ